MLERAEGDVVEAVDELVRGAAPLQRRRAVAREQGTHQEALKSFEAATKEDGNFALAYSALARTYSTLGYDARPRRIRAAR